ncbi:hypothetical protein [Streptomyces sp. NBC_00582]|uniref:hypothetical protein n=1 Tax=Streptomyces sp. NBC_00582 TaxID=2975783 RepID=UPI002E806508|nr:hypothetical protein [Streptomyces sp. NBC_00582]WUB60602.1 hypothetical protein OG852_09505 [Streptomyces sp. NBC_00582]
MGVSRRALLVSSGSAAAGAVLASAGPAQAEETETAEQADESTPAWGYNIPFHGVTEPGPEDGYISVSFTIDLMPGPPEKDVTALEVANAINELLTSRGWPAIRFYGNVPKALN